MEAQQYQLQIKVTEVVRERQAETLAAAKDYTDRVTRDLGECINLQFEELINNIKTTEQLLLKGSNQRLAISNSFQEKLN